jgi:hypothetical protein
MKKIAIFLFFTLYAGKQSHSQTVFGEYKSLHAFVNTAILDNRQYGVVTGPPKLHIGGGLGASVSINDNFNLLGGLNFLQVKPNNTRSDYSFCESFSCLPMASSSQLFVPLGIEYYDNTDQSPFQMFYALRLIPSISISESMEVIPHDSENDPLPSYQVKDNGIKFQDLQIQIAINNEFSLSEKYKIYIEPSASHSILFRDEDVINPDFIISIKVGFKIRKRK